MSVFKAIADPTRREILMMLSQQPASVNTISKRFNMTRPAVSKHIKILSENKLIYIQPDRLDKRQRNCHVHLDTLMEVQQYIAKLSEFWEQRLDKLDDFLDNQE